MSDVLSDCKVTAVHNIVGDQRYGTVRAACWSVCCLLALLDAWAGRQYTDPDGISYLDMSDALLKHNWHLLTNPHWSPLYPFLIGVATWLLHPTGYWELPLVHLVNLVIFLGALVSFEFLMRQVIRVLRGVDGNRNADSAFQVPVWRWQLLGYSLFASSTFVLISGVRRVDPDLCVAAFVYLDAGLLLRLRTGAKRSRTCLLLGLTLGLGYLAKAILFPMAIVFMAVACLVLGEWRRAVLPFATMLLVFSTVAAPQIYLISQIVGRPSFSESGALNIVWQINGEKMLPFYSPESGHILKHPMNLLLERPAVFSLQGPVDSTYSLWRDPWYWNAGASTAFNPRNQIRVVGRNLAGLFADRYMLPIWILFAGGIVLFLTSMDVPRHVQDIAKCWPLLIPGIAGVFIYIPVLVLPRYIAPFIVLAFLGLFPYLLVQRSNRPANTGALVTQISASSTFAFALFLVVLHLTAPLPVLKGNGGLYYRVAESLNRNGLLPGQPVAIIGSGWDAMMWARRARVHIVAQIPEENANDFWRAPDLQAKSEVYDAFAKSGARVIVTEEKPPSIGFADWKEIENTQYYAHFLAPPSPQPVSKPTP